MFTRSERCSRGPAPQRTSTSICVCILAELAQAHFAVSLGLLLLGAGPPAYSRTETTRSSSQPPGGVAPLPGALLPLAARFSAAATPPSPLGMRQGSARFEGVGRGWKDASINRRHDRPHLGKVQGVLAQPVILRGEGVGDQHL